MTLLYRIASAGRAALAVLRPAPTRALVKPVAVPGPYWDRDPAMLGNRLTPAYLTALLSQRNLGYLQGWTDLADETIEHDPHLFSQLAIRAQSVVDTDLLVLPGKGSNQRAARRAVSACEELLERWRSREGQGLETWLHEIVWGLYYGRSLHEVLWERDGSEVSPEGLAQVDPRRLSLACDPADPDPWALRIWDQLGIEQTPFTNYYGRPLRDFHPDKFLVNEPRVRGSQKTREGLFSVIVWFELFRTWSWRELMALAEMVSRPPVIATYAAGGAQADGARAKLNGERNASSAEIAAAEKAVRGVSGALRAVLPDTVRVEALKYSLPTSEPVPLLTSRECEALVSKTIHGVANLSDLQPGARAAVEAQERTSFTFWRADVRMVERLLSTLFARYIAANPDRFGTDCPAPVLRGKTDPPRDLTRVLDALERASRLVPVPAAFVYEATGFPAPKVDRRGQIEPVLGPVTASPPTAPAVPEATPVEGDPAPEDPPPDPTEQP